MVSGKTLLMYCNSIGIPSTGHMTPAKNKLGMSIKFDNFHGASTLRLKNFATKFQQKFQHVVDLSLHLCCT